ncbi:hypothetical protein [Acaryochloris marina]|uniref:hypothetical protein n=1 Tax=Acaryochloris marina TaxID=155978 RepID=UPI000674F5B0|nr:hypothetical protein [Acaryochloris marina]
MSNFFSSPKADKTLFFILFAVIIAPIQIAYHRSSLGRKVGSNLHLKREDQNFKRAIALIELHKLRFNEYPENLEEQRFQEFIGEWDKAVHKAVTYSRVESGYELNLNSQETLQLEYPEAFWNGLGLVKTNVGGFQSSSL